MTAKTSSLWGQILSAVWAAFWFVYMFVTIPESLNSASIIASAVMIPACFSPVFVSIILDKVKEIKLGKAE